MDVSYMESLPPSYTSQFSKR
uniref:Uncharacterized protein n=1 Tax=Anguilla anguilla TaxID=7936 RepID=A0A0E9TGY1_ANGAN